MIKQYNAYKIIISLLLCFSTNVLANELPSHYPKTFIWTGTIENISPNSIIISDKELAYLNKNISFHRINSKTTSINDLKTGMTVGCVLTQSNQIVSIWELPESFSNSIGPWAAGLHKLQP